ncbi:MAG: ribonuclease III [Clostridia bacterium]
MGLRTLLAELGIEVADSLLTRALTHSSYVNEHPGEGPSNERLEFLGDAVLGLIVSEHLFAHHPTVNEGTLSAMRSAVVRAETLAICSGEMNIGSELRLGRGEMYSGGADKQSVLSDAFEAVVAAIYLSCGLESAAYFVLHALAGPLATAPNTSLSPDPKSTLDRAARDIDSSLQPTYVLICRKGPDHDPRFTVEVRLGNKPLARGTARTKQRAEERAAAAALQILGCD